MLASLLKLLPILQLLMEVFRPGDGERVTRTAKITSLAMTLILVYSGFVSYLYFQQYHLLVQVREHDRYMATGYDEKKGLADKQADDIRDLYRQLFVCLGKEPYDSSKSAPVTMSTMPPPPVVAPEVPVHSDPAPVKKREAAKRPVGVAETNMFRQSIIDHLNGELK